MSLEIRKSSKWWYGVFMVKGQRTVINLSVPITGKRPPKRTMLGDDEFERSRGRAMEAYAKQRKDPSSGTIPTGYLIVNATQGTLKRHAGGYSWETIIGVTGGKIGFYGATPVVQPAGADQAAVTLGNTNGEIGGLTISNPPTQAEVQALRDACEELADDVRALAMLVHALRSALVAEGLIKGGV